MNKKLYVGNIPYGASEADLQNWFGELGIAVETARVARDRATGESRGFGFVEVEDGLAEAAIRAGNGGRFMGRSVVVNEAREPGASGNRHGSQRGDFRPPVRAWKASG